MPLFKVTFMIGGAKTVSTLSLVGTNYSDAMRAVKDTLGEDIKIRSVHGSDGWTQDSEISERRISWYEVYP